MEQRRFLLFVTISMTVLIVWMNVIVPKFFMPPKPPAAQQNAAAENPEDNADEEQGDEPGNAADENVAQENAGQDQQQPDPVNVDDDPAKPAKPPAADVVENRAPLPKHPPREILLGSLDPNSGFFMQAAVSSRGAVIEEIQLNDPRYRDLADPTQQLKIVGNGTQGRSQTFETTVDFVDRQLKTRGTNLAKIHWEVVPGSQTPGEVAFRITSPDGAIELQKLYRVKQLPQQKKIDNALRDTQSELYTLEFEFSVRNLSAETHSLVYQLQGPVGVPLENREHTSKFRDVRAGFVTPDGSPTDASAMTAATIAEETEDGESLEEWKSALRYIGVDVQYFAALIVPGGDQLKSSYVEVAQAELAELETPAKYSDVSVELTSVPIELAPGETATHDYRLFAGPKRQELLEPIGAGAIIDFGWFAPVSRGMLWIMNSLHGFGVPYALAIIMLTVMVRGCMYPISRKQAMGAKKMKEIQPLLKELQKKYANNKEKLARAQMELFNKHNYNPFAGCLPIFLQLPIFIGLYRALSSSVDLRMAPFLWVENLAAPDALFRMPFSLPFLGHDFNVLPLITVALFLAQQKMFMPPPADEQQAMQQKMMNYMMIFFGVMFYHVPAGLCVYFIASSLWGMGERKMLDFSKSDSPTGGDAKGGGSDFGDDSPGDGKSPVSKSSGQPTGLSARKKLNGAPETKKVGFWAKMANQLEAAAKKMDADGQLKSTPSTNPDSKKKKSRR